MCLEGLDSGCIHSTLCVSGPLPTSGASQSGTGTGTDNRGSDVILSQMVYGELVTFTSLVRNQVLSMSVMSLSIYLCRSSEPPHGLQKECQQSSCRQGEGSSGRGVV